jgi:hypothetical protein
MAMSVIVNSVFGGSLACLIAAAVFFGFFPVVVAKGLSRVFPKDDPRRNEMAAEVYKIKYADRVSWLGEQLGRVAVEGIPARVRSRRPKKKWSTADRAPGLRPLVISVPESLATTLVVTKLNDLLIHRQGETEVRLRLVRGDTARMFEIPFSVSTSADLFRELRSLLGADCVS